KPPEFCQDCVYLQSRCFSSATLLSCISATCNTVTCAGYATRIIEAAIQSFLDASCVKSRDHDDVWSWWENVIAAYTTPVTNHQEFTKESLLHGNFLSLHVDSMSRLTLPGFYGNEDLSAYTDDSAEREKLNDSALADACLLSSWRPTDDNSSKLFLIWDHFLHVCSLLI
uniref:Uncharacterized protein n=1 Tax=Ciona savignyi TaxID=51511 RepID=H2YLI8_CIOSA